MSRISAQRPRVLLVLPEEPETRELLAFLEQQELDVFWAREGARG